MKVVFLVLMAATINAQNSNPLSDDVRRAYAEVRNNILRSAEKMPAENYDFRPAPRERTFAQLIGHVAQEQYLFFCGPVKGEQKAADIERTKTTKTELLVALKDSFAYCDSAYNEIDLQNLSSSDEGIERAHLPRKTKVEVPQVQSSQDAGAKRKAAPSRGQVKRLLLLSCGATWC